MAENKINFSIQACSKCRYMLRCEECVYNEKDIAELIRFEKQLARKETAREILTNVYKLLVNIRKQDYEDSVPYYCEEVEVFDDKLYELVKQYGVEIEQ